MSKDLAYGWVRSDLSGTNLDRDQKTTRKLLGGMGYRVQAVFVEQSADAFEPIVAMLADSTCTAVAAPGVEHVDPWLDRLREHVDVYVPDDTYRTWGLCFRCRARPDVNRRAAEAIESDMARVRDIVAEYIHRTKGSRR